MGVLLNLGTLWHGCESRTSSNDHLLHGGARAPGGRRAFCGGGSKSESKACRCCAGGEQTSTRFNAGALRLSSLTMLLKAISQDDQNCTPSGSILDPDLTSVRIREQICGLRFRV